MTFLPKGKRTGTRDASSVDSATSPWSTRNITRRFHIWYFSLKNMKLTIIHILTRWIALLIHLNRLAKAFSVRTVSLHATSQLATPARPRSQGKVKIYHHCPLPNLFHLITLSFRHQSCPKQETSLKLFADGVKMESGAGELLTWHKRCLICSVCIKI